MSKDFLVPNLRGNCSRCDKWSSLRYVKTIRGFKKLCAACEDRIKALGEYVEADPVIPMKENPDDY